MSSKPHAEQIEQRWTVHWHDYLPAAALVIVLAMAWIAHLPSGGMTWWGVSAARLGQGRYETIALHMFAHGGLFHLLMNSAGLLEIGGLVTARMGSFARGWAGFAIAYFVGGLSSLIFFLSFHPAGEVPMIGASGAIYSLVGLLLGIRLLEEVELVAFRKLPQALASFVANNSGLLLLLLLGGLLAGLSGAVSWEAHLGGFLFGLCVGPWLLPKSE